MIASQNDGYTTEQGTEYDDGMHGALTLTPQTRHVHDYQMTFDDDPNNPMDLEFSLVCTCGDVAPDVETALRRTRLSRRAALGSYDPWQVAAIVFVAGACLFLAFALSTLIWE